jgi:DNA-binding MarR family transcriptional regulator
MAPSKSKAPRKSEAGATGSAKQAAAETFSLNAWLPYTFSFISSRLSNVLADFYKQRFGLSVPGWRVMVRIGSDGPLSAKEVGQLATIDAVQVTRAVNELAKLGFISRRVDAGDRRRVVLKLSAKGRAAFDAIVPVAVELERWLTEDLSDRERATLHSAAAKLLARVNDGLSDLRGQLVPESTKHSLGSSPGAYDALD